MDHRRRPRGRVECKNAAVCRRSAYEDSYSAFLGGAMHRLVSNGMCPICDDVIGYALDIEASDAECPVCYGPMGLGVKWNADACTHRFCPSCTHRMLFGMPRPTYELYQTYLGDFVKIHGDGSIARASVDDTFPVLGDVTTEICPMCRCAKKVPPWMSAPPSMEPPTRAVTCVWLFGPPRRGKTRAALDALTAQFGEGGYFAYDGHSPLDFMGYSHERGMLIDDYDTADVELRPLLGILSGDAAYVDPCRGAERLPLATELVYIISLRSPESYFPVGSPVLALITRVSNFGL